MSDQTWQPTVYLFLPASVAQRAQGDVPPGWNLIVLFTGIVNDVGVSHPLALVIMKLSCFGSLCGEAGEPSV